MNTSRPVLTAALAALAALLLSTPAIAGVIPVNNPSFEDPVLAAGTWSNTLNGWSDAGNAAKRFVTHDAGFNNGGNNHLGMEQGWQVWQDFPATVYEPFTIYALRAAAGHRAVGNNTVAGNISRIVFTNTAEVSHDWSDFNAFTGTAAGTFGQMLHRHSTGGSGGRIGTPLRVKLESPGIGRSHFDNIRLTSCGTFTGGDAGEGLDLQGDFQYAVNMGTNGAPGQIGDAVFTADTAAGVTLSNAGAIIDNYSAPNYGATTNDDRLEQAMRSIRHRGTNGNMTVTLGSLQRGRSYKLQLLFVEECCDRAFDVKVNGVTVFEDFRLQDFGVSGAPLVITHSFFATGTTASIVLDGNGITDTTLDRNPTLSAFTLERGFFVTTAANDGAGSLRQALTDAAARAGADVITFNPAVFNGEAADTITLATQLSVTDTAGVTIDASGIAAGVTVSGNNLVRVFHVNSTGPVTLRGLTVARGRDTYGAGCATAGTGLTLLENCTVQGNVATNGSGGLDVDINARLTLVNCTVTGNTASFGGGIAMNSATSTLVMRHCTVAGNTGTFCCGGVVARGSVTVENCIIAGNTGPGGFGPDINLETPTFTRQGVNLIGNNTSVEAIFPAGLPNANGDLAGTSAVLLPARLGPLTNNGGPTMTMMPQPNSPALDRIAASTLTTDQRGLPRVMWGKADIGAVEAGTATCYAWEVREFRRTPATALATLADAEALVADVAATMVTGAPQVFNFHDPQTNPAASGFFNGDTPFVANTAADDNDFVTVGRTFIRITAEDDYTFGFSSDDGARLRVFGATFTSSTRLNAANPANPAHSGDTLSFPGLTGNADTLGVCHLTPGVYPVEFLAWERIGGAYAEVFAARGAKTAVDGSFRLIGDDGSGPLGLGAPAALMVKDDPFTANDGGYTVTDTNGPFAGPWTYNAGAGTWSTAGQAAELGRAPSTALTTPAIPINQMGETRVQFTHRYSFEAGRWDGGQLQVSVNGGAFTAVPDAAFTANGYNGTVLSNSRSALKGQRAFVETSADYATPAFITSSASLGMIQSGDTVQLRFLAAFDTNTSPAPAWEITSVTVDQPGGWGVTVIRNGANSLAAAVNQVLLHWCGTPQTGATTVFAPVINFTDPQAGGGGHGQTQANFPGDTAADDDSFAMGARTTITVPQDGDYTFCILADDSVRFRVKGSRGWTVAGGAAPVALADGFQTNGCCADVFGQVYLQSGTHEVELIFNEIGGAAYVGLWAAPGRLAIFDAQTARYFTPVGTNVTGSSTTFALGVQSGAAVPPVNDNFANAIPLAGAIVSTSGCNVGATLETGEPATAEDELRNSVWWNWTAPATGPVVVDTFGSNFDTFLAVHTGGTLTTLTLVGENDDANAASNSAVNFTATAGTVYRIRVGGFGGTTGSIRLQIGPGPANDSFAAPTALGSPASLFLTGSNLGATAQPGEPQHHGVGNPASGSVWFTWTAPATGDYIIDTIGSDFDTVLAVYSGTALNALTRLVSDDDGGATGNNESRLVLFATAGTTYRIVIDGYDSEARGRFLLNITPIPVITAYSLRNGPADTRIFNLRWRSEPYVIYQVQSSSDLRTWTPVTTCTASEGTETDLDIESIPAATGRLYFRVARQ